MELNIVQEDSWPLRTLKYRDVIHNSGQYAPRYEDRGRVLLLIFEVADLQLVASGTPLFQGH